MTDPVIVVGGGYVGVEMAEAFAAHDLDVHLFEMLPHTLQPFGAETAATVGAHLREQGVDLHLNTAVDELLGDGRVTAISAGDAEVSVDLALVGAGVAPTTELAETAGINPGPTGAISTDEYGRTGVVDQNRAWEAGFDPVSVTTTTGSRTHYYPGGSEIQTTMAGDRESGRVLGASMVGRERVPERIDTVAAVLHAGMTDDELWMLDLSYAPPFSPVWDPVLTAAKVLGGRLA